MIKREPRRATGWACVALLAVAALLSGCDAPAGDSHDETAEAQAAAEMESGDPDLEALADASAEADDDAASVATEAGDDDAPPAGADTRADSDENDESDDGNRPATMDDVMRGLASLHEAVDAVQRGEDRAAQGTSFDGPRHYEEWDDPNPPLSVEFQVRPLTPHMMSYRIEVRSHADRLVIYDITLNRGNCGMAELGEFNEGLKLPVALSYGRKKTVNVRRCDKVLEATVDTQYGEYTFTWR